jgi:hypothetical protein
MATVPNESRRLGNGTVRTYFKAINTDIVNVCFYFIYV